MRPVLYLVNQTFLNLVILSFSTNALSGDIDWLTLEQSSDIFYGRGIGPYKQHEGIFSCVDRKLPTKPKFYEKPISGLQLSKIFAQKDYKKASCFLGNIDRSGLRSKFYGVCSSIYLFKIPVKEYDSVSCNTKSVEQKKIDGSKIYEIEDFINFNFTVSSRESYYDPIFAYLYEKEKVGKVSNIKISRDSKERYDKFVSQKLDCISGVDLNDNEHYVNLKIQKKYKEKNILQMSFCCTENLASSFLALKKEVIYSLFACEEEILKKYPQIENLSPELKKYANDIITDISSITKEDIKNESQDSKDTEDEIMTRMKRLENLWKKYK